MNKKPKQTTVAADSKGRENSYRKEPVGNANQRDIQQPGAAGDFGNGAPPPIRPARKKPRA